MGQILPSLLGGTSPALKQNFCYFQLCLILVLFQREPTLLYELATQTRLTQNSLLDLTGVT